MECWSCPAVRNANQALTESNTMLSDITSHVSQTEHGTASFINVASCVGIRDLNRRTLSHCDLLPVAVDCLSSWMDSCYCHGEEI